MRVKLSLDKLQATHLRISLRSQFEEWKKKKLEIRTAHIDALLKAEDFTRVKLRQDSVRNIDREIDERLKYLEEVYRAIGELTV